MNKRKIISIICIIAMFICVLTLTTACDNEETLVNIYSGDTLIKTISVEDDIVYDEDDLMAEITYDGYTFKGLYYDEEFTDEYEGAKIKDSIQLYAKYVAIDYLIVFDTGIDDLVQATMTVHYQEEITLPVLDDIVGYTFDGWSYENKDYTDAVYNFLASIKLFANWSANTTTVTFDVNGGQEIETTSMIFSYDEENIIFPNTYKEGYTFDGWYNGTTKIVIPEKWNYEEATLDLTAKWTAKEIKVYFDVNNGNLESQLESDEDGDYLTYVYDSDYTLPIVTKTGYTVVWKNAYGTIFDNSGKWTYTTKGTELIASWTVNTYIGTFDAGDGAFENDDTNDYEGFEFGTYDGETNTYSFITKAIDYNEQVGSVPEPTKTGYVFNGWNYTVNEVTYSLNSNKNYDYAQDITFTAEYAIDTSIAYKTEIYLQNIDDDDYICIDSVTKYGTYGETVTASYEPNTYMKQIENENSNTSGIVPADEEEMLVLKLYYDREYYTVTINYNNGDTYTITGRYGKEISEENYESNPEKTGYTFNGWSDSIPSEITETKTIKASWEANTYYLYIEENDGSLNGTLSDGMGNYYIEVTYGEDYDLDGIVTPPTDYIIKDYINFSTEVVFAESGTWTFTNDVKIVVEYEIENSFIVKQSDETESLYYFKEYDESEQEFVYVFIQGNTYDFAGHTGISADVSSVSIVGTALTCNDVGDFDLTIDGKVLTAKAVYSVDIFGIGSDYTSNWTNRSSTSYLSDSTEDLLEVGDNNEIILPIEKEDGMTMSDLNLVYTLTYEDDNGLNTLEYDDDYTIVDGAIIFSNDTWVDYEININMVPKYDLDSEGNDYRTTENCCDFTVKVREGWNVYDSDDMKEKFEDMDVHNIYLQNNIEVELDSDQLTSSGTPLNTFESCAYYRTGVYYDTKTGKTVVDDTPFSLNGNYYTMDGSDLPYMNNDYDERNFITSSSGYVNNVQTAMIGFCGKTYIGGYTQYYNEISFNVSNLTLKGNYVEETVADATALDGTSINVLSGSMNGIMTRGGTTTVTNSNIKDTLIAMFNADQSTYKQYDDVNSADDIVYDNVTNGIDLQEQGVILNVYSCQVDHSWGNSVYAFGAVDVNLYDSKIGSSGGAAVHFDDKACSNTAVKNFTLENTIVDNYVTGEESWFDAYGMTSYATQIKSLLNTNVNSLTGNTLGVVETIDGSQCINFVMFSQSGSGDTSDYCRADDDESDYEFDAQGIVSLSAAEADEKLTEFTDLYYNVIYGDQSKIASIYADVANSTQHYMYYNAYEATGESTYEDVGNIIVMLTYEDYEE
jgi:uncharacterized repeat protein (TIGR02543 family)